MKAQLLMILGGIVLSLAQVGQADEVDAAVVLAYQPIHKALAADDDKEARKLQKDLRSVLDNWIKVKGTSHPQHASIALLFAGSAALEKSTDLKTARVSFCDMSKGFVQFIKAETSLQSTTQLFYCSMAADAGFPYGYWVQPRNVKVANPYFGSTMLTCGLKKPW